MSTPPTVGDRVTLANPMRGFELTLPAEWSLTRVYPSLGAPESPPEVDFGFSLHPSSATDSASGCIGFWANHQPPQSLRFPQLMFLAHPLPPLTFREFVARMRLKLAQLNGTELQECSGLNLGGVPAGEYVYALGERRIRVRLAWHAGHRYSVFFAGDRRSHLAATSAFESLAEGVRLRG